jgi:amino acid transporter
LNFLDPALTGNVVVTSVVASGWFLVIALVLIAGIEITSRVQVLMTSIELVILAAILVAALVHAGHAGLLHRFSWAWFGFNYSPASFAASALVVVFFYWGWDVTSNLGEETVDAGDNAGNGGFSSVFVTIVFYVGFALSALCLFSLHTATSLSDNIVYDIAVAAGLGRAGGLLASIAVILSSIATLETTMLQFSRTLFAMGRDGAMPRWFGTVDDRTLTPVRAMYVLIGVGLVLIWSSSLMPSINFIISSSISAVGIQVAYYYGLTGLVAAWVFRTLYRESAPRWIGLCLFPAFSGLMLIGLGIYAITTFGPATIAIGLGGFIVGIVFFRPGRIRPVAPVLTSPGE